MDCIVFRARSKYAKFKKAYTTTSTLTHLFIPPTAVRGMIGAILGIDRVDLYKYTNEIEVAIQVLSEVNKDTQSFNFITMKKNEKKSFCYQSYTEFLRNVEYRIFIKSSDDTIMTKLENVLKNEDYFYTPYLGGTEHSCKLIYEGRYPCEKQQEGKYEVCTAFNKESSKKITFKNVIIYSDNIPVKNNSTREYIKYKKVYFPINEEVVEVYSDNIYKVGGKYIEFL